MNERLNSKCRMKFYLEWNHLLEENEKKKSIENFNESK